MSNFFLRWMDPVTLLGIVLPFGVILWLLNLTVDSCSLMMFFSDRSLSRVPFLSSFRRGSDLGLIMLRRILLPRFVSSSDISRLVLRVLPRSTIFLYDGECKYSIARPCSYSSSSSFDLRSNSAILCGCLKFCSIYEATYGE